MTEGEPYAFVTNSGQVVLKRELDNFAVKDSDTINRDSKDPFRIIPDKQTVQLAKATYKEAKKIAIANKASNDPLQVVLNLEEEDIDANIVGSKQAPELGITNYGFYGLAVPPWNPMLLIALGEVNTYHDRCCRTKAIDIGGLGHDVVSSGDNANEANLEFIKEFIEQSDLEENLKNAEHDRQQIGWGCLELIRVLGKVDSMPQRLEHVHAHTVRIHRNKKKFMQTWNGYQRRWFKRYGAKDNNGNDFDVHVLTGAEYPYKSLEDNERANELIYNPQYSARTSYYGTPDYIPAIRTMLGDQAAVDYNLVFFKNFGVPAYAVYITGNFQDKPLLDLNGKETGKSQMQQAMEDRFKEVINNPHGSMVFMIPTRGPDANVQVTFEKLSVETKESSFRLYRLDNRDEIITSHNMDPYRIGVQVTGALAGNVANSAARSYKSGVSKPGQARWELFINKIISTELPMGFGNPDQKLKLQEMDLEEEVALVDTCINLVDNSIMTPNEVIDLIGKRFGVTVSDDPMMDKHYFKGKMMETENPPIAEVGTEIDPATGLPKTPKALTAPLIPPKVPGNPQLPATVIKTLDKLRSELVEAKKQYESDN